MKSKIFLFVLFLFASNFCIAQDSIVALDTSMFDKYWQVMSLGGMDGWVYKQGNDTAWAREEIDATGWKKFKPTELTIKNAGKNGKAEGWFRIKIKTDSSFLNRRVLIGSGRGPAVEDIYINGHLVLSYGNTGANGKPFKERSTKFVLPYTLDLKPGEVCLIAVHVIDSRSPFNASKLQGETEGYWDLVHIATIESLTIGLEFVQKFRTYFTIWASVCTVLSVLFWLLYFLNRSEKNLPLIAIGMITVAAGMYCDIMVNTDYGQTFTSWTIYAYARPYLYLSSGVITLFILAKLLKKKITVLVILLVVVWLTCSLFFWARLGFLISVLPLLIALYLLLSSWKNLKGAQWAVAGGLLLNLISFTLYSYNSLKHHTPMFYHAYIYLTIDFLSVPLSLMVYVAIRFKEILNEVRSNANEVVKITEEKKAILTHQNELLEKQVEERTRELRASQAQLIQSEKMASLGELTAGIAHEIQNPLNFVNNFSEVNKEMIEELLSERSKVRSERDEALENEILNDIKDNQEKINHHGKRADAIVKGMLQHSRTSTGKKEPTDINALADEYLRLSYHGFRAKEKDFNATIETSFDESIGEINVIPQDIGRALLNLYNNAFYALNEKKLNPYPLKRDKEYEPTVSVITKRINSLSGDGGIEIRVSDNGNGIPQNIIDKIFQPFFTTKPTGQGTGLGLSLAYDIVKAHGGEIKVKTGNGEGTTFIIQLPIFL